MARPRRAITPCVSFRAMKGSGPAVALLMAGLLAAALPAGAQDATAPLLTDPEGDATLIVQGTPAGSANAVYPAVDVVGLSLAELPDAFVWTLTVNDLRGGNEETGADGASYDVYFTHNGREFDLTVSLTLPAVSGVPLANLAARDSPDGQWSGVWFSFEDTTTDLAADTLTVTLPRETLADLDGAVPFPGRTLERMHVVSSSGLSGSSVNVFVSTPMPYSVVDQMPNAEAEWATYAVQVGVLQAGNARLGSLQPFRASNGEATTFVYQVDASNIGEENATYQLNVVGTTKAQVVLPVDLLTIPGGGSVQVPVLATVPFAHDHGGIDQFLLEMRDVDDPTSIGRLQMGIRYLAVPQPAGHHDTVFLHLPPASSGAQGVLGFDEGFLNTMETDDREGPGPWHARGLGFSGTTYSSYWSLGLSPGLEMGLDFDLGRVGQAVVPVASTLPLMGATLQGYLYVTDSGGFFGDHVQVASFTSAPVDIPPNGMHSYQVELVPEEDADLIPFAPGQNLYLDLELTYTLAPSPLVGFADETPALARGGLLRLPLNEYHDDVDDALAALDGPTLTALGPQERLVNPGEATVFKVAIDNPTDEPLAVRLGLTGVNAAWGALDDDAFTLPPQSTANITVVVRAPADALDGDRADLILQAYPRDEPMLRGLLRLVADVDTDADHEDDAPQAADIGLPAKDTPAPSLALLALGLGAVAFARRRR